MSQPERPVVEQIVAGARRQGDDSQEQARAHKRQRKGKARSTTKRRQNRDELEKKQAARAAHNKALQESSETPKTPCKTCLGASDALFDDARELLAIYTEEDDQDGELDDEEVHGAHVELMETDIEYAAMFNGADSILTNAYTHTRTSHTNCIAHSPRQRVATKQRAGGVTMRSFTIKNGLRSLLNADMPDQDKEKFIDGIEKVVEFNRKMVIHAMAFAQHFVAACLAAGMHLPRSFFDQTFFYGVFQLILGKNFTNTSKFNHAQRTSIDQAFRRFKAAHPGIKVAPVPSPGRKPSIFAEILASTAQQLATIAKSHVVENFDSFYINFLEASLSRRLEPEFPNVKPHVVKAYASYAYQRSVRDADFPAEEPACKVESRLKNRLETLSDALVLETEAEWHRVAGYIQEEERNIKRIKRTREAAENTNLQAQRHRNARQFAIPSTSTSASNAEVDDSLAEDDMEVDDDENGGDDDDMEVDDGENGGDDDVDNDGSDDDDAMSTATGATSGTQATVGSLGVSSLSIREIPPVNTSTIAKYPHFFLREMYRILAQLETWNDADQTLEATAQSEVNFPWTRHVLEELLQDEWKTLNHRKRTQLTRTVMLLINGGIEPVASRLSPSLSQASKELIVLMIEETQYQIDQNTLVVPQLLVRSSYRLFTLVPVPSFRLRHIHINHTALKTILLHFGLGAYNPSGRSLPADGSTHSIFSLFDMTRLQRSPESAFENSFGTDGFSTSFTFKRPKGDPPPTVDLDKISPDQLRQCRAWGVDPGVDQIFVAVDGSSWRSGIYSAAPPSIPPSPIGGPMARSIEEPARLAHQMKPLPPPPRKRSLSVGARPCDTMDWSTTSTPQARTRRKYTTHAAHEVRRMSAPEYNHMAGIPQANAWLKERKDQEGIVEIESRLPTAKTARVDRVQERVRALLQALPTLLSFYNMDHQAKRFSVYRGKQKANAEMVNIFLGGGQKYQQRTNTPQRPPAPNSTKWRPAPFTPNDPGIPPLIFLGDGQFGRRTWRGKPHGHAKRMRGLLNKAQRQGHLIVTSVKEAFTSQVCSGCGRRGMDNIKIMSPIGPFPKLHSVVKCRFCLTLWQRDRNAARNIHALGILNVQSRTLAAVWMHENPSSRPLAFTKSNQPPPKRLPNPQNTTQG